MAGNFEGIKTRNFGIEIEMTGLTRCQAAKAIAKALKCPLAKAWVIREFYYDVE